MNYTVRKIIKNLGMQKDFALMMVLRAPFDFLSAVLNANMLESFIRLVERGEGESLAFAFWKFFIFTMLLFGYNVSIWATISIKTDMMFHRRLRRKLMDSMLSRTEQNMEMLSAGDWITRLNTDIDKTADYITCPLNFMHAMIASVNLVLSSVILVILNPKLFTAAILVMIPFFILSSVIIIRKIPFYRRKAQESQAKYTNWMEPIVEAGDAITIFDGEEIVMKKVEEESLAIMRQNVKAHKLTAWSSLVNIISGNLGYILLLLMGNSMIGNGVRDFAELTKITQYRGQMMMGVMCVNSCMNNMKSNLSGAERVNEVLDVE
jgi:ABC-type multidrug transport system, ATPase and permease components